MLDASKQTFEQWLNDLRSVSRKRKTIKNLGRYSIWKDKSGTYNLILSFTGAPVLGNYKSVSELEKSVLDRIPEEEFRRRRTHTDMDYTRSIYDQLRKQELEDKKYKGRHFRLEKRAGEKVLDMGAGTSPDWRATHAIDLARPGTRFSGLTYSSGYNLKREGLKLPYSDNKFDRIVSYGALGRNFDSESIYKEINRILKPGGVIEINAIDNQHVIKKLREVGFTISQKRYFDSIVGENVDIIYAIKSRTNNIQRRDSQFRIGNYQSIFQRGY